MSLESVLEHVAAIERMLTNPIAPAVSSTSQTATAGATSASLTGAGQGSFALALSQASEESQAGTGGVPGELSGESPAANAPSGPVDLHAPEYPAAYPYGGYAGAPAGTAPVTASPSPETQDSYSADPVLQTGGTIGVTPDGSAAERIVSIAESQIGQSEQPPGSNESPAIARYRTATAGSMPGEPWCAYFASWAAREAGDPIGSEGHGLGAVGEIWSWAQSTGRALPNGPGVVPKPGDLIVFGDEHVGIVKGLLPDGDIQTIEGNYDNRVSANVRTPTEATGYVEMS